MAFTEGPTVIHIKLTNKGRQLLSTGQLTFSKFSLGDSEINYEFNDDINFNTFSQKILRPKDENPNIVDFIEQTVSGATMIELPTVVSNTSIITNTAPERGFFTTGSTSYGINNDISLVKNPYGSIWISGVTGGTIVDVDQSADYVDLGSTREPIVGDYMLVKWANPYYLSGATDKSIDEPLPYLWYKVEGVTGTLAANDLVIEVDKPLPDFQGNGGDIESLAYFYPNSNNREVSGDSIQNFYGEPFSTDFLDAAVLSFFQNWDCSIGDQEVPVWNMSIIFTDEVAGVQTTDLNYTDYYTKELGGFVRYIQQISPWIKKIGVVHYTNALPLNTYGEGLVENTPILELPTIMWHKATGDTIGVQLSAGSTEYTLTGLTSTYRELSDQYGNVVGKVFNDLQVFVIEDQELLFAMSYKANRSWTLPEFTAALNVSLCPESDVDVEIIP